MTKWMTKWQGIDDWTRALFVRLREDSGQALAEYGLILAFIAAVSVLALTALGLALAGQFAAVTAVFP
jgi:Flp pilus assembly pilin Flp